MSVLGDVSVLGRRDARDAAARELFAAHYARLAGWCLHLTGDEQLAHEFAAEAFTRLLAKWTTVDDPRGYLYVTAANLVKDHWRRLDRERRALSRVGVGPTDMSDGDPTVRDLVERLPERYRQVVVLHYYADFAVRDVARLLRLSDGTVKRRLFEARALLHSAMEEA